MKLQEYFDAIYVINLLRRHDRWVQFHDEFYGQFPYERFDGYDHPTNGHEGCTRTHRTLMREIANGSHQRVLIFEDDCSAITLPILKAAGFKLEQQVWKTFCTILNGEGTVNERFAAMLPFLPEKWDVLYLGAGYGSPPISRFNEHIVRADFIQTNSSYGVTRDFAKAFDERLTKELGSDDLARNPGQIDNVFGGFAKDHLFYVFQPRLFFQRESKSDLTGETHSYLFSMCDPVHEGMVP